MGKEMPRSLKGQLLILKRESEWIMKYAQDLAVQTVSTKSFPWDT